MRDVGRRDGKKKDDGRNRRKDRGREMGRIGGRSWGKEKRNNLAKSGLEWRVVSRVITATTLTHPERGP